MSEILFLADGIPNESTNGGDLTILGMLYALCSNGNEVTFINTSTYTTAIEIYNLKGEKLVKRTKSFLTCKQQGEKLSRVIGEFPGHKLRAHVDNLTKIQSFDSIFTYHWNGAASIPRNFKNPVFCFLGDPLDAPYSFPLTRSRSLAAKLRISLMQFILRYRMRLFVPRDAKIGAFSFGHCAEYRKIFKRSCNYVRTPILSKLDQITQKSQSFENQELITLVHLGIPSGTFTRNSLDWLNREVFPVFESDPDLSMFRWLFVGRNLTSYQKEFPNIFTSSSVMFIDHIQNLTDLSTDSSVLIVPSEIRLGIRTRILTAFQLGIPVLSNSSSEFGIPELSDMSNYFSFQDVNEFVDKLKMIATIRELRFKIAEQAHRDLQRNFSTDNFYISSLLMS